MTMSDRDKRALIALAVLGVLLAGRLLWVRNSSSDQVAAADSIPLAEKRLSRLMRLAAAVPAREAALRDAQADLTRRERGLLQAETAAQAQSQLVQIVRKIARAQTPPVEIRGQEMGAIRPYGDAYGEAVVSLAVECGIDQLVNIMAQLTAIPDLVSTDELRFTAAQAKEKTVPARITVSALVPKKLVPAKKESSPF